MAPDPFDFRPLAEAALNVRLCRFRKVQSKLIAFKSYKELKLPEAIARNLDKMGFLDPTPVQAETIPAALDGADILGTAVE